MSDKKPLQKPGIPTRSRIPLRQEDRDPGGTQGDRQRHHYVKVVVVGGRQYEINGIPFGTVPAWQLIKQGGQPMTSERFAGLPEAD
jgi:hypothetical protein